MKQEVPDFLNEYCPFEKFSKLLKKIIIHSDVTTPRQVKKLINSFINNYMIAYEREQSKKVKPDLFTSEAGQEQIAKFSVLQADFNRFYDLLFLDFNYLDKILEYQNDKDIKYEDLDLNLKEYFEKRDDILKIKTEYEGLFNFLNRTKKYTVNNIAPFLYIAQDDISIQTGDALQQRTVNALRSQNYSLLADLLKENNSLSNFINYYLENSEDDIEDSIYTVISVFDSISNDKLSDIANTIIEKAIENNNFKFLYKVPTRSLLEVKNAASREDFSNQFLEKYLQTLSQETVDQNVLANSLNTLKNNWEALSHKQRELVKDVSTLIIDNSKENQEFEMEKFENVILSDADLYNYLWGFEWFKAFCNYLNSSNDFNENNIKHLRYIFSELNSNGLENEITIELQHLIKYPVLLPILNELLSRKFCENIDSTTSTKFAENLISLDYEKNSKSIYPLLGKLKYEVKDDNKEPFSTFTARYTENEEMYSVLEYIGKEQKYELIDSTIISLIEEVFKNNRNDSLLVKVIDYFTEQQQIKLTEILKQESIKYSKASFEQENKVFSILSSKEQYKENINSMLSNIFNTLNSYYNSYPKYFDFVLILVGDCRAVISSENVTLFLNFIKRIYTSQQDKCIQAIRSLSGVINEEQFKELFKLLMENATESNSGTIFNITMDNNNVRPTDSENLTKYKNFLVNQISKTEEPAKVLNEISNSFSTISNINQLISESLKNSNINKDRLAKVVTKFVNNIKNIDTITDLIIESSKDKEKINIVNIALTNISNFDMEDVRTELIEKLKEDNVNNSQLRNLLEISKINRSSVSNELIYTILKLSYEHVDQTSILIQIIDELVNYDDILLKDRIGIADILREGFIHVESDKVRKTIVNVISVLKLKREFKKGLSRDLLGFYNDNVK